MDYPHNGDDGTTGYLGPGRVKKSDLRIETIGSIDEATATLGIVRASTNLGETKQVILEVQRDLYNMMAEAAADKTQAERFRKIDEARVAWLESKITVFGETVHPGKDFILPGDCYAGAVLDLARTIVRRAERRLVELTDRGDICNLQLVRYLNRLSTLLFLLEQIEYKMSGITTPSTVKGE